MISRKYLEDAKMRVLASLGSQVPSQPTGFPMQVAGSYFGRGQSAQTQKEQEALKRMEQGLPPEPTPEEIEEQKKQQQQQQPQQQGMRTGFPMSVASLSPDMASQSSVVNKQRSDSQLDLQKQREADYQRMMEEERKKKRGQVTPYPGYKSSVDI